jgi:hypothetical protein
MSDLFGGEPPKLKPPSSIAYKTVTNFLESFQDSSIPSHIDRSVLPGSMSGGNQAYLVSSLKYLGLISDGGATNEEKFHRLVKGNKEQRAAAWREVLMSSYDFLFKDFDIERATTSLVSSKFKEQGISGDSIRKAMTFFLFAAKEAEIKVSSHIKPASTRGKITKPRKQEIKPPVDAKQETTNDSGNGSAQQEISVNKSKELPYQLIDILDDEMSQEEQDAVWTLIRYLKKQKVKSSE